MKKRTLSFLLALVMCLSLLPMTALAAGDTLKDVPIPKPAAPNYFMTDMEYENHSGDIRIVTLFDNSMLELVRENDIDPEGFSQSTVSPTNTITVSTSKCSTT